MAQSKKQLDNLKKGKATQFSGERAVECGRKGGKQTAKNKAAKKRQHESWKELGEMFLPMATKKGELTEIETLSDLTKEGANITVEETIFFALLQKAMRGDISAINQLFTMTGWNMKSEESDSEVESSNGFIKALNEKAVEVWEDDENDESKK